MIRKLIRIVLALMLMAAPAMADAITLTGTVTYHERMALPPGAQLRVTLVALPSGEAVAGASAAIPAKGQVPLEFTLDVRSQLGGPAYGLLAEISAGGRVLFRNARPVSVDPASGQPVQIVVQSMPRTPIEPLPLPPPELIDITWKTTSIGGRPVLEARPVTLSIAADQRASGHGGCNNYFAEASIVGTTISFGPAAATRMACPPEVMAQENAYFTALAAVASFALDGTSLRLLDAAGVPLIGLVHASE
ncbi:MAG: hypothetical protein ABS76_24260 [Pelagibacterium sp. SCN 64-44]|nr:MAG: hypothetical protein ABS76_24260 [Pelagibacterium sp. SCN 64-44]